MTPEEIDRLPYRPCVGIVLFDARGRVFVAQRIDMKKDAWQLPQGGIDEGEEPKDAALRELKEEIGTANAEILGETKSWLNYDLPADLVGKVWRGRYRGQTQKWFAMKFLGDESEISPEDVAHPEFSAWKWTTFEDIPEYAVEFKRKIYQAVVDEFASIEENIRLLAKKGSD